MKDHSAEQRLRHYGPCYLAGAPASAGALPSKDRKNVQSAGLISGRSTEPAARGARAFDRDIMALLLHRAINRDIAAGKFKRQVQLPILSQKKSRDMSALLLNRAINRDIMSMNLQLNRLLGYCLALPSQLLVPQ